MNKEAREMFPGIMFHRLSPSSLTIDIDDIQTKQMVMLHNKCHIIHEQVFSDREKALVALKIVKKTNMYLPVKLRGKHV